MYKLFYDHIRSSLLAIGYLNLLRSFFLNSENIIDKNYEKADEAILKLKDFCKLMIKDLENLFDNQNSKIKITVNDIVEIKEIVKSVDKPASHGMIDEIIVNLKNLEKFVKFLKDDFPHKNLNPVDIREIKTELNIFKYQIYLSYL